MKAKNPLTLGIVLLVLSSCASITTKYLTFSEEPPASPVCNLELWNNISISLFDGEPVKWAPGFFGSRTNISNVPAGRHLFVLDWTTDERYFGSSDPHYVSHHEEFEYTFEAGHTYQAAHFVWTFIVVLDFGIKIKDITQKRK
jgi:hypothetical protein